MRGPGPIRGLLQDLFVVALVLAFIWINRRGPIAARDLSAERTPAPPRVADRGHPLWDDWLDGY
jgi:hypothetical protein